MKSSFTRFVRAALGGLALCLLPAISRAVDVTLTYGTPQQAPAPASPEFGIAISVGYYWTAYGETAQDYLTSYKIERQNIQLYQSSIAPYTESLNNYFRDPNSLGAGVHAYAVYVDGVHPEAYDRWIEGYDEDEIDENGEVTGWHHVDAHREVGFDMSTGTIGVGRIQFIIGDATPVIVTSPQAATANVGAVATFSVVASGNGVWVDWQRLPAGGSTWTSYWSGFEYWMTPPAGQVPGSVLNVRVAGTWMNGDQYRAIVINPAGSVTSASAALTVTVPHVVFSGGDAIAVSYGAPQQSAGPTNAEFAMVFSATASYTAANGDTASDQLSGYTIGRPTGSQQTYSLNYTNRVSETPSVYQTSYRDLVPLTLGVYTYWVGLQALHPEAFDRSIEAHWEDEHDNPDDPDETTGRRWVDAHREIGFDWSYQIVAWTAVPFYVGVAPGAPVSPPTIVVQPAPKTFVFSGGAPSVVFSCSVASELMADMKWQRRSAGGAWGDVTAGGGYSIASANNRSTLTVTIWGPEANGDEYRCVASNAAGSATSNGAVLNVYTPPVFVSQPSDRGGIVNTTINVSFTATATGQPAPAYQWQRAGSGGTWIDLGNGYPYSGADTATLTYNGYMGSALLMFRCIASNAAGSAISRVTLLQPQIPPSFDQQPQTQIISASSPNWPIMTYFTASASGTPGPTLQWQRRNPDYSWSNLANGGAYSGVNSMWLYVSGTAATVGEENVFRCLATNSAGSTASNTVFLYVPVQYPFGFNVQPQSRTVPPGCSATFTATAVGTPAPNWYEWQRLVGGVWQDMGVYANTLTVSNVTAEMNGYQYRCRSSNGTTSADSNPATLTVDPSANCDGGGGVGGPAKPIITKQPQDQIVAINGTATFSVEAIGAATYRWYRNGGLLSGITASSFVVVGNFDQWQNGDTYQVEVSNTAGSVFSNIATLYVTRGLLMVKDVTTNSFRIYWGTSDPGVVSHQVAVSNTGTIEDSDWRPITSNAEWIENGCSAGTTYLVKVRGLNGPGSIVRETAMNITTRGGVLPSSLRAEAAMSSRDASPREAAMNTNTLYSLQSESVPASRWLTVPRWMRYNTPPYWRLETDTIPDEVTPTGDNFSVNLTRLVWTAQPADGESEPYDFGWETDADGNSYDTSPVSPTGIYHYYLTIADGQGRFTPSRGYQYQIWYYTSDSDVDNPANWKNLSDESDESKIRPDGSYVFDVSLLGLYGVSNPRYALVRYGFAPGGCVLNIPGVTGGVTVSKAGGGAITIGSTKVTATSTVSTSVNGVTITANGSEVTASTANGVSVTVGVNGISLSIPKGLQTIFGAGLDALGNLAGKIGVKVDDGAWGSSNDTDLGAQTIGSHSIGVTNDTRGMPDGVNGTVPPESILTITLIVRAAPVFIIPAGNPVTAPVGAGNDPANIPDGANEFTYSTASPGVLTIKLKAKVPGVSGASAEDKARYKFVLPSVGDSTLAWDSANPLGQPTFNGDILEARASFSTLPTNNTAFGPKTARLQFGSTPVIDQPFEVFFPKDASNHASGQAGNPNWYHYWMQTSANRTNGVPTVFEPTTLQSYYDFRTVNVPNGDNKIHIEKYGGGGIILVGWGNPKGIDYFAWITAHEAKHAAQYADFWPSGYDFSRDSGDGDLLPDSLEPTYMPTRPYRPDRESTYIDTVGYSSDARIKDREDINMRSQILPYNIDKLWENGSADSVDWANPGKNNKDKW